LIPCSFAKHRPDRRPGDEAKQILAFPVVPPQGWIDGKHYHVVLVAGGPFDELRGVCFAFKVRLKTYRTTVKQRPFLMASFLHPERSATLETEDDEPNQVAAGADDAPPSPPTKKQRKKKPKAAPPPPKDDDEVPSSAPSTTESNGEEASSSAASSSLRKTSLKLPPAPAADQ